MKTRLAALAALALSGCAIAPVTQFPSDLKSPYEGYSSDKYGDPSMWLCRPDRLHDACRADLTATEIKPDASKEVEPHRAADDPAVDCFYVYPTVDSGFFPTNHTSFKDLAPMSRAVTAQAARFSEVCNVYAPLYRQATIGAYFSGEDRRARLMDVAFSDVLDAFLHYLGQYNHGRKVVLVGHSQGGDMVVRLVQRLFDGDPALRERLLVAMAIGTAVEVPLGQAVGGTFQHVPLCQRAEQTGCVVAFRTHVASQELKGSPFFAVPAGLQVACVNPADPARNDREPLARAYFPADKESVKEVDADLGQLSTRYVLFRNYYTAQCVDGPKGYRYLAIGVAPGPGEARHMPFDLRQKRLNGPMGTHFLDMLFTQGDLIDLVARKAAAAGAETLQPSVALTPPKSPVN
ncbi:MAG TPA: DUF3089 domain-containing protein [Myxococcales bacterium]|jgi:pimeloyl-ACP methyl ester carboxylesterase